MILRTASAISLYFVVLDMRRHQDGEDQAPRKRSRGAEALPIPNSESVPRNASQSSSSSGSRQPQRQMESVMSISFLLNDSSEPKSPSRTSGEHSARQPTASQSAAPALVAQPPDSPVQHMALVGPYLPEPSPITRDGPLRSLNPRASRSAGPSLLADDPSEARLPVLQLMQPLRDGAQPLPQFLPSPRILPSHPKPLVRTRSTPTLPRVQQFGPSSFAAYPAQASVEGSASNPQRPEEFSNDPRWCSHCNRTFARTLAGHCSKSSFHLTSHRKLSLTISNYLSSLLPFFFFFFLQPG